MLSLGILYALLAALTNSAIDSTRKVVGKHVPPNALVALPALLEAAMACAFIKAIGGFDRVAPVNHPHALGGLALASGCLLLAARFMYQSALACGPLSLTVPYISFTPAILVAIAYVWLGETVSVHRVWPHVLSTPHDLNLVHPAPS